MPSHVSSSSMGEADAGEAKGEYSSEYRRCTSSCLVPRLPVGTLSFEEMEGEKKKTGVFAGVGDLTSELSFLIP